MTLRTTQPRKWVPRGQTMPDKITSRMMSTDDIDGDVFRSDDYGPHAIDGDVRGSDDYGPEDLEGEDVGSDDAEQDEFEDEDAVHGSYDYRPYGLEDDVLGSDEFMPGGVGARPTPKPTRSAWRMPWTKRRASSGLR